jgi:hypothetical protein
MVYETKRKKTKLKLWIDEEGYKISSLARRWGITKNHASHFISGHKCPDEEMMKKICDSTRGAITAQDIIEDYKNQVVDRLMDLERKYCSKP